MMKMMWGLLLWPVLYSGVYCCGLCYTVGFVVVAYVIQWGFRHMYRLTCQFILLLSTLTVSYWCLCG